MVGRPSNRDERYVQIMEALVRCVARFGLEGASLSQVATEAGLTRPLIRHHLGNRDEILDALQSYVLHSFDTQTTALVEALPVNRPASHLIDLLFSDFRETTPDMVLAFAALTARAVEDPALQGACRNVILGFEAAVADAIRSQKPRASASDAEAVAHGIVALYFNVTSLTPLQMPEAWGKTAYSLARRLLAELED